MDKRQMARFERMAKEHEEQGRGIEAKKKELEKLGYEEPLSAVDAVGYALIGGVVYMFSNRLLERVGVGESGSVVMALLAAGLVVAWFYGQRGGKDGKDKGPGKGGDRD